MTDAQDRKTYPTFAQVKSAALRSIESVLSRWVPDGKKVDSGHEYAAANPTRSDKTPGSFKINLNKGTWSDFATGDAGGDLIDLVAYIDRCSPVDACNALADFLNIEGAPSQQQATKPKDPKWIPVTPIPEAAMASRPVKHFRNGKPANVWIYRSASGEPLMMICRFNLKPGNPSGRSKAFSPQTWGHFEASSEQQWQWKSLPNSRPLLNLDQLAERPSAPVIITEGEKAADAAGALLPEYVATCWPNGSNGWKQADFKPLKGRTVVLWRDNDEPGQACMDALAAHLRKIGATVKQISLDVFHQKPIMTAGKPGFEAGAEWPEGADAADAQESGWTAAHVAELARTGELFAAAATKPKPARKKPASASEGGGFKVKPEGVFFVSEDGESRQVCSRLEILARTRDEKGHNWGLLVEFDDPDGGVKRLNISASSMAGDFGKEVLSPLVNMGLRLAPNRAGRHSRNDLQTYLQGFDSVERARLVARLGWHDNAYLMPEQQIGASAEQLHYYDAGAQLPPISQAGTLEQWQSKIGALCVGNPRLAFVVSVAFAGPLLKMLGHESGGFHLYGDSSGGKTTHLQVAASVWGGPRFVRTWRTTDNALEGLLSALCDSLAVLDEIGQCEPRIIGETIYMIGNGTGKSRANDRGQAARPAHEWRVLFLSTGEKTLAQHMAEAGKEMKAGMDVRMLAIPAEAGQGMGLFERLHGFVDPAALSDNLKARAGKYYGTPAVAFLESLTKQDPAPLAVALRHTIEHFVASALPAGASGQAQRAATRIGLVGAAGELATGYGITGWPDGWAMESARVCLTAWLAERGGAGNLEGEAIVQRLRLVIERYGESRFTRWDTIGAKTDDHAPRTVDRLGFRRTVEHGAAEYLYTTVTYYCLAGAWRDEVFKGMNLRNVNRELVARGILEPSSDGKAAQAVTLPGLPKSRAYVVCGTALMRDVEHITAAAA